MFSHVKTAFAAGDAKALAAALRIVALNAPPGSAYASWASYALEGAGSVERSNDVASGRDSCRTCHLAYRRKFQLELRNRPMRAE